MNISIIALGGTICMQQGQSGALECALSASELASAARLEGFNITCKQLVNLPSPSLELTHIKELLLMAKDEINNGAKGVVITQGTDTLEESSYLASLLWDEQAPLIFTGAMKSANELGADGASNLHASVKAAASLEYGVALCFNDELFIPKYVYKSNSLSLQTFKHTESVPTARFYEGEWFMGEYFKLPKKAEFKLSNLDAKVGIYTCALGDSDDYFKAILDGYLKLDAVVINGFGAGHVQARFMNAIKELAQKIPIALTSRPISGLAGTKTYGYAGSEIDLAKAGVQIFKELSAIKARLYLIAKLSNV